MSNRNSLLLLEFIVLEINNKEYTELEWEILIRQARASGLLSRLATFEKQFFIFQTPSFAINHLDSAYKFWQSQQRIVNWELHKLSRVFDKLHLPLILLKGSAYSAANLDAKLGRVFNDIDILVPKTRLPEVKEALNLNGWFPEPLSEYDKRYYEEWMHELPPLRHINTGASLDVHHNILPLTCSICPDANALLTQVVNVSGTKYWTLCFEDIVLHSASHLFLAGEFENGIRDLSDLDLLLREFSRNDVDFWQKLLDRAELLNFNRPLFYALRYTRIMLNTPIPELIYASFCRKHGNVLHIKLMDFLFLRALRPAHSSCDDPWSEFSRSVLFLRSHWLKMPLQLLIPHLVRKAWVRIIEKD